MAKVDITAQRLRELLDYDCKTGLFRWRISTGRVRAGSAAGCFHPRGYVLIRADGVRWLAHRLAWLHHHGVWPTMAIDHIDGCKSNNAIDNLRDVSLSNNQQNQVRAQKHSKCGLLGVAKNRNKWRAQLTVNGRQKYLGTFYTPEEAHTAYLNAKRVHHEGCTI